MRLEHLELVDFRAYTSVSVEFLDGPNVLVGRNAQGKTNVLEAVNYLATGSSHRTTSDGPLVRAGEDAAIIRARARSDAGRELRRFRNRAPAFALAALDDAIALLRAALV